jgi:hypothetical protein
MLRISAIRSQEKPGPPAHISGARIIFMRAGVEKNFHVVFSGQLEYLPTISGGS